MAFDEEKFNFNKVKDKEVCIIIAPQAERSVAEEALIGCPGRKKVYYESISRCRKKIQCSVLAWTASKIPTGFLLNGIKIAIRHSVHLLAKIML